MHGRPMTIDVRELPEQKPAAPPPVLRQDAAASATYAAAAREYYEIPSASQREWSVWKLDGTELYKGLGSGFYD